MKQSFITVLMKIGFIVKFLVYFQGSIRVTPNAKEHSD